LETIWQQQKKRGKKIVTMKSIVTGPELTRTRRVWHVARYTGFFLDAYRYFPLLSFPVPLSPSDHSCSGCWWPDDRGFVITSACGRGFAAQVVLLLRVDDSTWNKVESLVRRIGIRLRPIAAISYSQVLFLFHQPFVKFIIQLVCTKDFVLFGIPGLVQAKERA
jgi:hypothetical protein